MIESIKGWKVADEDCWKVESDQAVTIVELYSGAGALLASVPVRFDVATRCFVNDAEAEVDLSGTVDVAKVEGDQFPDFDGMELVRGGRVRLNIPFLSFMGANITCMRSMRSRPAAAAAETKVETWRDRPALF